MWLYGTEKAFTIIPNFLFTGILATIHNVVLALIKQAGFLNAAQARRWFGGHIDQPFAPLITGISRL